MTLQRRVKWNVRRTVCQADPRLDYKIKDNQEIVDAKGLLISLGVIMLTENPYNGNTIQL